MPSPWHVRDWIRNSRLFVCFVGKRVFRTGIDGTETGMHKLQLGDLTGIELRDGWGLLPDPMDRCRRQSWWKSVRKEGLWFPSYDDDAFWPTRVPGAFTRVHPQLEYYEGNVVYLNHFAARLPVPGERAFLHFGAAAERCSVFLNGIFLGEHDGGYTAFTFEVTRALKEQNRLLVLVDNRRLADAVPGLIHDWWHDGGLHRPVRLLYRPSAYVRECAVTTELVGADVVVRVRVLAEAGRRDPDQNAVVRLVAADDSNVVANATVSCRPGAWAETVFSLPRSGVRLWSPADPYLYRIEVALGDDRWSDAVGLRELCTRGREILVNGEPVILRGVGTWIEDPDRGIFSLGPDMAERTVAILRDLNCNFARAGHRPPSREFVRACDRAGILVWAEVPAYWLPDMQKAPQTRHALQALEEMVREHRNSPSVVLWSIGNECAWGAADREQSNIAYFIEAADWLREQDPSRLVTYTGGIEGAGTEKFEEVCPLALIEKLDVIGVNSYAGINDGAEPGKPEEFPQQYAKLRFASSFGKPVILAEAGIDAVKGETGFDFGEERQRQYHAKLQGLFRELAAEGALQGMALFVLNDYKTPIKLGRYQRGYNRKGLVTTALEPKPAYAAVREGYGK